MLDQITLHSSSSSFQHHRLHPYRPHTTTASMAAVFFILLLLLPLLPSTTLAVFPYFLACGAASNVSFPGDSPARTFVLDAPLLSSTGHVPDTVFFPNNLVEPHREPVEATCWASLARTPWLPW